MKLHEAIAKRTEKLAEEKGYSQYKIARLGGTYQQNINRLINGEIKNVSTALVWDICCAFEISLEEFYADKIFSDISD